MKSRSAAIVKRAMPKGARKPKKAKVIRTVTTKRRGKLY